MGKRKAKQAESQGKLKKKRRGRNVLFLLMIGGAGAFVLSEGLRSKALDALFGSEEEFQYSPPPASDDGAAADAAASTEAPDLGERPRSGGGE